MSDQTNPDPGPGSEPSPEDVQKIGAAAAAAAADSKTPEDARTNIDAAVRREAAKLELSEDQVKQLAELTCNMMIEQMQALGAFDAPPVPEPGPQPPASADPTDDTPPPEPPRKPSLAERWAGLS